MSLYKRGNIYWYKFMWNGKVVRQSTKQGNDKVARQMESAHRTSLAKGEVGIRERKPSPTLRDFINKRVDPWAQATFKKNSPGTYVRWYRTGFRAICGYAPLASCGLDELTSECFADFASYRLGKGMRISTVNSNLRVLRRILGLAVEWGVLTAVPKMKLLLGERGRDRVVSQEEEAMYLAASSEPWTSIATVLFDTGLRPGECFRLRWEALKWLNGRRGTLTVVHGKSPAARRTLPMTARVQSVLQNLWLSVGEPEVGYLWPKETTGSGYVHAETIRKTHLRAIQAANVRPFVLHSIRHTFLTRLGESGCDAWTLARIAGHASIKVSSQYVHPSEDAIAAAMSRLQTATELAPSLGGHKFGHSTEKQTQLLVGSEVKTHVLNYLHS
jgi:integrase